MVRRPRGNKLYILTVFDKKDWKLQILILGIHPFECYVYLKVRVFGVFC